MSTPTEAPKKLILSYGEAAKKTGQTYWQIYGLIRDGAMEPFWPKGSRRSRGVKLVELERVFGRKLD